MPVPRTNEVGPGDWNSQGLLITPRVPSCTMAGPYKGHHALQHTTGKVVMLGRTD
jgi:hypothetical protein